LKTISSLEESKQILNAEVKKLSDRIEGKGIDITELTKNIKSLQDKYDNLQKEANKYKSDHETEQKSTQELQLQFNTRTKELAEVNKQVEELQLRFNEKAETLEKASKELEDLKSKYQEIQEIQQKFEAEKSGLTNDVSQLQGELKKATEMHEENKTKLSQQLEDLRRQAKEKEVEYKVASQQNIKLIKELKKQIQVLKTPPTATPPPKAKKQAFPSPYKTPTNADTAPKIQSPSPSPLDATKMDQDTLEELGLVLRNFQEENIRLREQIEVFKKAESDARHELIQKSKLIQEQANYLKTQGRSSRAMEEDKLTRAKKGGVMGSLFGGGEDLNTEMQRKMSQILEDTLLKNMQLQDDISAMGDEVDRLMEENKVLKNKLRELVTKQK